ncbi:MAG: T9SS C-terminal target domain-containing protein, partial [Chitinophagia bacterium]|nr:T9SS C-terminal target domain-containing protein [Chitinophagia bacterium]
AWIANSGSSNNTTIPMMGLIAYQASSTTSFTIPITDINTSGSAISALFKTTAAATQMNIDLMKNNILFDRCILREDADATAQRLDQKDLLKMENVTANVYALTPANDHLSVYTEPSFTQAIPLAISAPVGTYQFNIQNAMNSTADWYLIDNYLHQQKLLTNNSTYSFDINNDAASKGSQRFELSKQTWTTSIGTTSNQESIQLLGNLVQDHITLQVDATIHQANYQLVDLRGAVLAQGSLSAGKQEIAMASLASGLYILHIQNDHQRLAYKITKQ